MLGRFLDGSSDADETLRVRNDTVRRLTPVGTTSVVFKVELGDESLIAFRPRTRSHPGGWLAEVAAFRIARALEMDQVPLAAIRLMSRTAITGRFDEAKRDRLAEIDRNIVWDGESRAIGVAVPWVPRMQDLGFESGDGVETWATWLSANGAAPDNAHASLARDMSMLLTFDYLIGNFDRMSGGNLKSNENGTRVVIRDHNLAFVSPMPETQRAATLRRFMRVERFSRSQVAALRRLDAASLSLALDGRTDPEGVRGNVLTAGQQAEVLARRQEILERIDSLVRDRGENAVLTFE